MKFFTHERKGASRKKGLGHTMLFTKIPGYKVLFTKNPETPPHPPPHPPKSRYGIFFAAFWGAYKARFNTTVTALYSNKSFIISCSICGEQDGHKWSCTLPAPPWICISQPRWRRCAKYPRLTNLRKLYPRFQIRTEFRTVNWNSDTSIRWGLLATGERRQIRCQDFAIYEKESRLRRRSNVLAKIRYSRKGVPQA